MDVRKARKKYEQACKFYAYEVQKAFPKGTLVSVTLGRSHIEGHVLWAGETWWSGPGDMAIRNVETGKVRKFDAGRSDVKAV